MNIEVRPTFGAPMRRLECGDWTELVPVYVAAEIERLQSLEAALGEAMTALEVIAGQDPAGYDGDPRTALVMARGTAEFALSRLRSLIQP